MLKPGDQAPDFTLNDAQGDAVSLDDLLAEGELILYFYPADFSPVCTAQACAIRDNYAELPDLGLQVVGISPQGSGSHDRFVAQYELPFPLLSDVSKKVIRAFGVDGPLGFGVRRATYHIGKDKLIKNRVVADFSAASHIDLLRETVASVS